MILRKRKAALKIVIDFLEQTAIDNPDYKAMSLPLINVVKLYSRGIGKLGLFQYALLGFNFACFVMYAFLEPLITHMAIHFLAAGYTCWVIAKESNQAHARWKWINVVCAIVERPEEAIYKMVAVSHIVTNEELSPEAMRLKDN